MFFFLLMRPRDPQGQGKGGSADKPLDVDMLEKRNLTKLLHADVGEVKNAICSV